jgi:hypothetical protein
MGVRGSNLARLYYTQRFGEDFDQRLYEELRPENGLERVMQALYKITWAMSRAENYYLRKPTPDFERWLKKLIKSGFDLSDCIDDLLAEIVDGFTVTRTYGSGPSAASRAAVGSGPSAAENASRTLPWKIITVALKMGMTLDEINEMTTQTLIDIMHEFAAPAKGSKAKNAEKRRMAAPREAADYFGGLGGGSGK